MTLEDFYQAIENKEQRDKLKELIDYLLKEFPSLDVQMKWNQPMLILDGSFILGFSVSKKHFSVSPDKYALDHFTPDLKDRGYDVKKMLFSIKWEEEVDYKLMKDMVAFNIEDRKGSDTFWRTR